MRKLQIKNLRIDNDLTQEEISKKLKINRRTYADYENLVNETPLDIFVNIARFYNVSLEYLAGLTNVSSPTLSLESYNYEKMLKNIINLREKHNLTLEKLADKIVITSDNPRSEDPQVIITDIIAGLKSVNPDKVTVEPDRGHAIALLKNLADNNDVVVIAGKGHEDYQILKDRTIHFDDREEARKVFEASVI